jgi:hypothetical protein
MTSDDLERCSKIGLLCDNLLALNEVLLDMCKPLSPAMVLDMFRSLFGAGLTIASMMPGLQVDEVDLGWPAAAGHHMDEM